VGMLCVVVMLCSVSFDKVPERYLRRYYSGLFNGEGRE